MIKQIRKGFNTYLSELNITNLTARELYAIKVAYYRGVGDAVIILSKNWPDRQRIINIASECADFATDEHIKHTFGIILS